MTTWRLLGDHDNLIDKIPLNLQNRTAERPAEAVRGVSACCLRRAVQGGARQQRGQTDAQGTGGSDDRHHRSTVGSGGAGDPVRTSRFAAKALSAPVFTSKSTKVIKQGKALTFTVKVKSNPVSTISEIRDAPARSDLH